MRYTNGTAATDYTYTGQYSHMADFGLMFYNARWYDPGLGRFTSADTVVPGGVQGWDRYAYGLNNPSRYTDPSGHDVCDEDGNCYGRYKYRAHTRMAYWNAPGYEERKRRSVIKPPIITSSSPSIGQPGDTGTYVTGYTGGTGGTLERSLSGVYGDGDCVNGICSFSGGSVPLRYGANYDAIIYTDLTVITLHEHYWMPGYTLPLLDNRTFGGSNIISTLQSGEQVSTNLGLFTPGGLSIQTTNRITQISYWGKDNFPVSLTVQVTIGAENMRASQFYYQLNFVP